MSKWFLKDKSIASQADSIKCTCTLVVGVTYLMVVRAGAVLELYVSLNNCSSKILQKDTRKALKDVAGGRQEHDSLDLEVHGVAAHRQPVARLFVALSSQLQSVFAQQLLQNQHRLEENLQRRRRTSNVACQGDTVLARTL